jgi:hypothetical protein
MTTQPQSPSEQEIRAQIAEILGVETDPNGTPEQYLIRNERGRVINGIDFKPEIDQLEALIAQAADKREQEVLESLITRQELATTWVTAQCPSGHRTGGPYSSQLSGGDEDRIDYLRDEVAQRPYCGVCGESREIIEETNTSVYYDVVSGDKIADRLAQLRQGRAAEGEGR